MPVRMCTTQREWVKTLSQAVMEERSGTPHWEWPSACTRKYHMYVGINYLYEYLSIFNYSIISLSLVLKTESYCKWGGGGG